jgi:protein-L-isoaspartate O-methyltransferase
MSLSKRLKKSAASLLAYQRLILNKKSYIHTSGWYESLRNGFPCRADGSPIPWMNYSIVTFLEQRLQSDQTMFEYGSGFSTKFYAQRVQSVTSVEHVQKWFDLMMTEKAENMSMIQVDKDQDGQYCRAIQQNDNRYDVIIVDGRDRVNCVKQSYQQLSDRGVMLLDDSERDRYQEAMTFMQNNGFRQLDFEGIKPKDKKLSRTTLFYRPDNCFGI